MNPATLIPLEVHWLWSATWQAAVLTLLVLLIQGLGRDFLSPSSRFALWWLVLIRLCLPVTPESAWSVFNLAPQRASPIASSHLVADRAMLESMGKVTPPSELASGTSSQAWEPSIVMTGKAGERRLDEARNSMSFAGTWLYWIWLIGALGYGASLLTASMVLGRHLRRQPLLHEPAVERLIEECRQRMGIRRRIEVIETARVRSPALFGLVRPRLLIPPGFLQAFTETELRHVLTHELAHLRRGDLWLNWWMVWIQAVHWFNPLVWLLLARIRSDRELACDSLAMARITEPDRTTYGQTVLKLLAQLAAPGPVPGSVGVLEDRRAIERRVQSIIHFRPHQRCPWIMGGLWLALAALTLTNGRSVPAESGASPTEKILDEISDSSLADGNVKSALEVLNIQLNQTRRELPAGLTNEFEESVVARLNTIQESVKQSILPEYKNAWTAKQVLELSENVLTLPYRDIPDDARQRQNAHQQYAAVLERVERLVQDKTSGLSGPARTVIEEALRPQLTAVRQNILQPGYGRPLSVREEAELNRIVDRMLEAVSALPKVSENRAGEFREAAKVASDGGKAVWQFLRSREAGLMQDQSLFAAIHTWRTDNATIEQAVDAAMQSADKAELDATMERFRQQEEKDLQENDPHTIAERIRQQEENDMQGSMGSHPYY